MKTLFSYSIVLALGLLPMAATQADPTKPASGWAMVEHSSSSAAAIAEQPRLQLIKRTADSAIAIINGQVLRPGDNFQQYRLVRIDAESVLLTDAVQQRTLYLLNASIKHYDN